MAVGVGVGCGDGLRVSSERLSHPQPQCLCCKQELGCQRSVDPWEQAVPGYVLTMPGSGRVQHVGLGEKATPRLQSCPWAGISAPSVA